MHLSVVIPLYNCLPLTQAMVRSLEATLPRHLTAEIILVDDGSTDGTRDWLATLGDRYRVLLNSHNLGYAGANNRGAEVATGENLLLLNNDLLLTRGWLEPMLAAQRHLGARAGLIGNIQRTVATGEIDHTGININEKAKPEHDRSWRWSAALPHPWSVRRVPAVTGACLLVARELFRSVGGLSEDFVNGCEDVDLAFRLAQQGRINAVALRSVVSHHVSASPGRKRRDELNTYRLALRWREQLVHHASRRWAWAYLIREWTSPTASPEAWTAAEILAYALHLRRQVPPEVVTGARAALDHELTRWRGMFDAEEAVPSGDEAEPSPVRRS